MSTIITALIIIICTIGIPLIFRAITKRKHTKENEKRRTLFSQEGSKHGLSFSCNEVLKNKIIGFGGLRHRLLILEFENAHNVTCINMEEVRQTTVERKYDSILIGSEQKSKIEPHLRSIDLKFFFKNQAEPVSVSFYEDAVNSVYEMRELEAKAETWVAILTKMIYKEEKVA